MNSTQITLSSNDGTLFTVNKTILQPSNTIKQMLEDIPESNENIPLIDNSCTAIVVHKIIEYLQKHHDLGTDEEKEEYNKKFIKMDDELLFNVILAANYLDIKDLLDLGCKTVAEYIKQCKSTEEIRTRFNIENDFTPEEEQKIREENAWCDEIQ